MKEVENKINSTFFYNHPKTKVASIIALFVLIFVATLVITLTVINSSSPKDVQIPNVVNLTQEEAKQKIEQLKLKFAYKEEYSESMRDEWCYQDDNFSLNGQLVSGKSLGEEFFDIEDLEGIGFEYDYDETYAEF